MGELSVAVMDSVSSTSESFNALILNARVPVPLKLSSKVRVDPTRLTPVAAAAASASAVVKVS